MRPEVDPERQIRAREYATLRRRLALLDLAIGLAYVVALLLTGASVALRDGVQRIASQPIEIVALYAVFFGGAYTLLTFPLAVYSGHVLPRRYGISVQSLGGWLVDWLKGSALGGAFVLGAVELIYALLRWMPNWWWLVTALALLCFTVVLTQLTPTLLIPLFYRLAPLPESELTARLRSLAERTGTTVAGVYRLGLSAKTTAANAMLAGLGRSRRIVLGDTLLDRYTPDEIETVFAHELGNQVHGDIPKLIAIQSALTLVGLYLVGFVIEWGVEPRGLSSTADVAGLPLLALALGAFFLVTGPLGNAASRTMEAAADRYAVEATGKPLAFADAMRRLADQNLAEYHPPRWVEVLLHDHPATSRRVEAAEEYARERSEAA
jgi:STE24 endopeptidase